MIIRKYRESDQEAIKEITVTCFDGNSSIDHNIDSLIGPIVGKDWAWRMKKHIDENIAANAEGIFVSEIDDSLIGYISTRLDHGSGIGLVTHIAVLSAHRNKGIGRMLLDEAVSYFGDQGMKHVRIGTLEANTTCRHLYPSYGFKEVTRQIVYIMPIDEIQRSR